MEEIVRLPLWFLGDAKMMPLVLLNASGPDFVPLFQREDLAEKLARDTKEKQLTVYRIQTWLLLLDFVNHTLDRVGETHFGLDFEDGQARVVSEFARLRDGILKGTTGEE